MQIFDIPVGPGNRETTKPGPAFPLGVYCSTLSRNVLGYTPLHWNDELQFCAVTKGRVLFSVNENKYLLETGDGIFINSGYLHMARPVGNPDSTYICLDVGKAMLAAWPGSILESRYLLPALKAPELACLLLRASVPWQQEALDRIGKLYDVEPVTVRQWIRRGKLREAEKVGKEWRISELTDVPGRARYEPATYKWINRLKGIPEEFAFLSDYTNIDIRKRELNVTEADPEITFIAFLSSRAERGDGVAVRLTDAAKDRLEAYLIANPDVLFTGNTRTYAYKHEETIDEEGDENE